MPSLFLHNQKGEIATIAVLATFIVLSVATIAVSVVTQNKDGALTTSTRASEKLPGACPSASEKVYVDNWSTPGQTSCVCNESFTKVDLSVCGLPSQSSGAQQAKPTSAPPKNETKADTSGPGACTENVQKEIPGLGKFVPVLNCGADCSCSGADCHPSKQCADKYGGKGFTPGAENWWCYGFTTGARCMVRYSFEEANNNSNQKAPVQPTVQPTQGSKAPETPSTPNKSCPEVNNGVYIDTFSTSIGASPNNPKCVCGSGAPGCGCDYQYKVVDMKYCQSSQPSQGNSGGGNSGGGGAQPTQPAKAPQTGQSSSGGSCSGTVYRPPQGAPQPNCADFKGKLIQDDYYWNVNCSKNCNTDDECKANGNPGWCYGFGDGRKCMSLGASANGCQVQNLPNPQAPAQQSEPSLPSENSTEQAPAPETERPPAAAPTKAAGGGKAAPTSTSIPKPTCAFSVQVIDASGTPLSGALVSISQGGAGTAMGSTNANGLAQFSNKYNDGPISIKTSLAGYATQQESYSIVVPDTCAATVSLAKLATTGTQPSPSQSGANPTASPGSSGANASPTATIPVAKPTSSGGQNSGGGSSQGAGNCTPRNCEGTTQVKYSRDDSSTYTGLNCQKANQATLSQVSAWCAEQPRPIRFNVSIYRNSGFNTPVMVQLYSGRKIVHEAVRCNISADKKSCKVTMRLTYTATVLRNQTFSVWYSYNNLSMKASPLATSTIADGYNFDIKIN